MSRVEPPDPSRELTGTHKGSASVDHALSSTQVQPEGESHPRDVMQEQGRGLSESDSSDSDTEYVDTGVSCKNAKVVKLVEN